MLAIKQLMVSIDIHSISFPTMEVNGEQQLFGSSELFKISSPVLNKRISQNTQKTGIKILPTRHDASCCLDFLCRHDSIFTC